MLLPSREKMVHMKYKYLLFIQCRAFLYCLYVRLHMVAWILGIQKPNKKLAFQADTVHRADTSSSSMTGWVLGKPIGHFLDTV